MTSKTGGNTQVVNYLASLQYGVCVGPVDTVKAVYVNEKKLELDDVSTNTVQTIDDPDIFGGSNSGGGVKGKIHYFLGDVAQTLSAFLASKLGRTPSTVSANRGTFTVWFTGSSDQGFLWSTNVPMLPAVWFKVTRRPTALSGTPMIGENANPAHIIYECLVNTDFGSGYDPSFIDEDSFLDAAQVFRDEDFGLSFKWDRQGTVESFTNEVLQHVGGILDFNGSTRKWRLKLLRKDYDLDSLVSIGTHNSELLSFQRRGWGESVNQVTVAWTNPKTELVETVTQQDATGFYFQKTAVSNGTKPYYGVRTQELAWTLAERDLRQESSPLASVELNCSLSLRGIRPGDVVLFDWNELDRDGNRVLNPTVMRVLRIKEPKRGSAFFGMALVEDIFSFGVSATSVSEGEFVSPSQEPVDVSGPDFIDAPYFLVAQAIGDQAAENSEYPSARVAALGSTFLNDIREIQLFGDRYSPPSGTQYTPVSVLDDLGQFVTTSSLSKQVESTVAFVDGYGSKGAELGGFLVLGAGDEQEICLVVSLTSTSATIKRGCLDTIPSSWPSGTVARWVKRSSSVLDTTEATTGQTLLYKMLPVTSARRLKLSEATERTYTVQDRLHRPLRPANVAVNGSMVFATSIPHTDTSMIVSWSKRNRVTETSQVLAWDDTSVTAEAGQTTEVELRRSGILLASAYGVSGTTTTLDLSAVVLSYGDSLTLSIHSIRSGFTSWKSVEIPIAVT